MTTKEIEQSIVATLDRMSYFFKIAYVSGAHRMWRFALYILFVLFAAPIDSILAIWSGFFGPDKSQLLKPIAEALLYIYAFIIAVETLFRIAQNQSAIALKPWLRLLQFAAGCVVFLFIIDYVNVLRPLLVAGHSVEDSVWRQTFVVVLAVVASVLSYVTCEPAASDIHVQDSRHP